MQSINFNYVFWENQLNNLSYPLSKSKIPTQFLRDKRAIPPGIILNEATLVYHSELGTGFCYFSVFPSYQAHHKLSMTSVCKFLL